MTTTKQTPRAEPRDWLADLMAEVPEPPAPTDAEIDAMLAAAGYGPDRDLPARDN